MIFVRKTLARWALVALMAGVLAPPATAGTTTGSVLTAYQNPLNVPVADPFVLQENGVYYLYGTSRHGASGFEVYTSPDLIRWTLAGYCYRPQENSWGTTQFWAPEVVKAGDEYFLHFTSLNPRENRRNIIVARAKSPLGPFLDYAGPLFPNRSVIDSHILHDEKSGRYYVYASPEHDPPSRILGAELSPKLDALLTTPTVCLTADYGWEDLWIEGPIIFQRKSTWYMIYSAGAFWEAEYGLGYATALSPLGPWEKSPDNPILEKTAAVHGPGHNGLALSPDGREMFVVYHRHASPYSIQRVVALDRLAFDRATSGPDRLRVVNGATHTPQPLPSGATPLAVARSDDFSSDTLDMDLWEIYQNQSDAWRVADDRLEIRAGADDLWREHTGGQNVFLQRLPHGSVDFTIETSATMDAERVNEQVFLILWQDADNYVMLATGKQMGDRFQFIVTSEAHGKADSGLMRNALGWPIRLKMERRGNRLQFFARGEAGEWQQAGRDVDVSGRNFTHIGLGAWSPGSRRRAQAWFDEFTVKF